MELVNLSPKNVTNRKWGLRRIILDAIFSRFLQMDLYWKINHVWILSYSCKFLFPFSSFEFLFLFSSPDRGLQHTYFFPAKVLLLTNRKWGLRWIILDAIFSRFLQMDLYWKINHVWILSYSCKFLFPFSSFEFLFLFSSPDRGLQHTYFFPAKVLLLTGDVWSVCT